MTTRVRRGPPWEKLRALKPTNQLFARIIPYRTFRLDNRSQSLTSLESGKIRDYANRISTKFNKEDLSTVNDPITVFHFLQKLEREFNLHLMSEAQASRVLSDLLAGITSRMF